MIVFEQDNTTNNAGEAEANGITSLLIEAMDRHIEWSGVDHGLALAKFVVDHDIDVSPVFYSTQLPGKTNDSTKRIEAKTRALVHYDGDTENVPDGYMSAGGVALLEQILDTTPRLTTTRDSDGRTQTIYSFDTLELTLSENREHFYLLTFFDLLALLAAEDARRDERADDEAALVGMLPAADLLDSGARHSSGGLYVRGYRPVVDSAYGAIMRAVAKRIEESITRAVTLQLAQYAKAEVFQNHDFSAKAIDGLFRIAMGEPFFELVPRSGRSRERYTLTASEDACTKLFQVRGANAEQVRAILGTLHSLIKNPRAAEFAHEGRVWFTVNRIAEELLRTSAGTIRGKDYPNVHDLVDAALEAASGAQIKATSPDGVTTKVVYLLDAVRLDEVAYNGETYKHVWGIAVSAETLAEYAEAKGHAYHYELPKREAPFTLDTVWINSYLTHAMNEARGKLYSTPKSGKGRPRRRRGVTTVTLKRLWQGGEGAIFDLASPTRALTSRQKDRLVRGFEDELTNIVRDESHGGLRSGMPLYVRAWSERDGGKGRGKGAYRVLCLEVSNTFRAVRDGTNGHGSINLRDGIDKSAPDNAQK